MSFTLDYRQIMRKIEADLTLTITVLREDVADLRRGLSQAKIRQGIAGRLSFSTVDVIKDDKEATEVTVVLLPSKKATIEVLNINLPKGL